MRDHRIPHGLYEALPYFYLIVGLISANTSQNLLGQLSGALLISAALVIHHLRRQYRQSALLNRESQMDISEP